jgi:hypothetical protein
MYNDVMITILKSQTFQEFMEEYRGTQVAWRWSTIDDFDKRDPEFVLMLSDDKFDYNYPHVDYSGKVIDMHYTASTWFCIFEFESDAVMFTLLLDR